VLGAAEGRVTVSAADLAANDAGNRILPIPVQSPAPAGTPAADPAKILPGRSGVYPLEVEVRRAGAPVNRFVTPAVVIAPGLVPLTVAWVWRLDATPAHQPDGTVRKAAAQVLAPGG